ncbi:polysaccharide biosynthesis/export family protein [Desulforhabdus sp. TSK]|uniref:polysaccharide biosynthesis/export family protein n=1 Tax=Desulforhabdus sp. TSK TaxID=2925014 RepID=UPI001FC842F0|nr:polysaccharide biosynthesis/export family protein [Desulforhabdus sp. TSK]GKT10551.1 sugar ABC transporter substrate-binding protein [Desulforhabdus sp. TSK]
MKKTSIFQAMLLILLLTACSTGPVVKNPTPVGSPAATFSHKPAAEYRINTGDQLDIKFFYNPELNEQLVVRPDGKISLQLIEEVMAAGRTPAELTEELKQKYTDELANPVLTVIVRSFTAQKVYVDGEVNKPGVVELVGPFTVLQSIAFSGGLRDTARTNEVVVIRRDNDYKPMAIPVNLRTVIDGTDMRQDIVLAPYDIVFVPKSPIGNAATWVDLYLRRTILVLPQEFLLYYSVITN